jgi:transcriptional regulator with XRE-family HTH domain
MVLTDRKKLAKLMVIQDVSHRELARAAGWKSHSYLGRLLRGEVNTLDLEPAIRIAMYLGVGTDDLFMSRSSSVTRKTAKGLVAA